MSNNTKVVEVMEELKQLHTKFEEELDYVIKVLKNIEKAMVYSDI
jgi:hypothetical protein